MRSLTGDRAFQRLRKGRSGGARLLSLRWMANQEGYVRVGIVVSKKVGKAVVRNRTRRRLREALNQILNEAEVQVKRQGKPSFDLVIIVRPEAAEADYWQLKRSLVQALTRGGLVA